LVLVSDIRRERSDPVNEADIGIGDVDREDPQVIEPFQLPLLGVPVCLPVKDIVIAILDQPINIVRPEKVRVTHVISGENVETTGLYTVISM
jgi:hypothetical protein